MKLGLIAGGGELPFALAEACAAAGRPLFVVRLKGFADAGLARFPGADIGIAELGRTFETLKQEGCGRGLLRRRGEAAQSRRP